MKETVMHVELAVAGRADDHCGVADYAALLAQALGPAASLSHVDAWDFGAAARARANKGVLLHVQYPSMRMGRSVAFMALPLLGRPFVLTLHEFSIFSLSRKLFCAPAALFSKRIIFTNAWERDQFCRMYPFARRRTRVIPISCNIEVKDAATNAKPRVLYFGHILEGKGVTEFLELAKAVQDSGLGLQCMIMGGMRNPEHPFSKEVVDAANAHGIETLFNAPDADISAVLGETRYAYLPFPDGLSEKRGSALACMAHGVNVLTTHTHKTPDWMAAATAGCKTPAEAFAVLKSGWVLDAAAKARLAAELDRRTWPAIAAEHMRLYREIVG